MSWPSGCSWELIIAKATAFTTCKLGMQTHIDCILTCQTPSLQAREEGLANACMWVVFEDMVMLQTGTTMIRQTPSTSSFVRDMGWPKLCRLFPLHIRFLIWLVRTKSPVSLHDLLLSHLTRPSILINNFHVHNRQNQCHSSRWLCTRLWPISNYPLAPGEYWGGFFRLPW